MLLLRTGLLRRNSVFSAAQNLEGLCFFGFLALILCTWIPSQVQAQIAGRTLSGKITNTTGSGIPGAQVSLRNTGEGTVQTVPANQDGTFAVQNLTSGTYEVTVSAPGFADAKMAVKIVAGDQTANFTLQSGAGTGKVEGASSAVSGIVNSKSVTDLPLNGRSASDLATLEPGVATARTQTSGQGQRGFGNQMTISGGRPRQNDSRLDGISVNDYANGPPGSALGVNLGSDAVEQFTVLSSNYPAQFGRSSGGIIGASTRSGTKEFHGNAFEYIRNSALDARNFFDTTKPAFRRNQFGGSIGGPIVKDRTFFFADYEGLRQSQGTTQVDTVPSQAARDGHLCAPPDCSSNTVSSTRGFISRASA